MFYYSAVLTVLQEYRDKEDAVNYVAAGGINLSCSFLRVRYYGVSKTQVKNVADIHIIGYIPYYY